MLFGTYQLKLPDPSSMPYRELKPNPEPKFEGKFGGHKWVVVIAGRGTRTWKCRNCMHEITRDNDILSNPKQKAQFFDYLSGKTLYPEIRRRKRRGENPYMREYRRAGDCERRYNRPILEAVHES